MTKVLDCPFCNIEDDENQIIQFSNELVLFAEAPMYQGALKYSGVVIPIAHRENVFDLTSEEVIATFEILNQVKGWMDEEYSPDGYNVGWNCGKIGGQEIFHAHMHVIPRFKAEPMAGKGIRSYLKSDANRW